MTLTNQIKEDYGTLKRYARLKGLSLQSLYMTLNGYPRHVVVTVLIEDGYIEDFATLNSVEGIKSKAEREAHRKGLRHLVEPDLGYDQVVARQG